jgi:fatty acid desaturase
MSDSGDQCITNIGPRERRRRLLSGVVALGIALSAFALLAATGVDRWWRLLLFLPFAAAASGYFQARDKT